MLIDQIRLLPLLYCSIIIPPSVVSELTQTATPDSVRTWIDPLPEWVTVKAPQNPLPVFPTVLGPGEREAILLAEELCADVLLADDEAARFEAGRRNIPVQGTLGILDLAAEHGLLVALPDAVQRLRATNFRASKKLLDFFLDRDSVRRTKAGARGS